VSRRKLRGFTKQPVERVVISPEKRISERKVVLNPESNEYEVKYIETITPAVVKVGRAQGPTTPGGKRNVTENMAPKGSKGAAPLMRKKGM